MNPHDGNITITTLTLTPGLTAMQGLCIEAILTCNFLFITLSVTSPRRKTAITPCIPIAVCLGSGILAAVGKRCLICQTWYFWIRNWSYIRYSSCSSSFSSSCWVEVTVFKKGSIVSNRPDRDEIWRDCYSGEQASLDGVGYDVILSWWGHDVILGSKVLPPGEWTWNICRAAMQQRTPVPDLLIPTCYWYSVKPETNAVFSSSSSSSLYFNTLFGSVYFSSVEWNYWSAHTVH